MIQSFADRETERLFYTGKSRQFGVVLQKARIKLQILDNTKLLSDLREPSGNRLEALKGRRKGQYSIRVNDQYRICFLWIDSAAHEVALVDYH